MNDIELYLSARNERLEQDIEELIIHKFKDVGDIKVKINDKMLTIALIDRPELLNEVETFIRGIISTETPPTRSNINPQEERNNGNYHKKHLHHRKHRT